MSDATQIGPDILLAHADFVRRIARGLLGDGPDADDLAGDVMVQALRHPPAADGNLRGWFARVATNLRRNRARDAGRRRRAERRGGRDIAEGYAPPVDEIAAREEVRRRVVEAALGLAEPYRSVVVLRYFEGLDSPAIARRLGRPAGTVRSQLKTALERLRGRLDAQSGGDRSAWVAALAPLARLPLVPLAAKPWALTIGAAAWLAASLAVVAGLGWLVWPLGRDAPHRATIAALSGPAGSKSATDDPASTPPPPRQPRQPAPPVASTARRDAPPVFPAERGRGTIRGFVFGPGGDPQPGVTVEAEPYHGPLPPMMRIGEDRTATGRVVTDRDGAFVIPDLDEGPIRVTAQQGDLRDTALAIVSARALQHPLRLDLARPETRGEDVRIRVLDGSQPVAGIRVDLYGWSKHQPPRVPIEAMPTEPLATATTGADGFASFVDRGIHGGAAFAAAADGRAGWCPVQVRNPDPLRAEIDLAPVGSLRGRIAGVDPDLCDGAIVQLHALADLDAYSSTAGRRIDVPVIDGRFQIDGLAAGIYGLHLVSRRGLRIVDRPQRADRSDDAARMPTVEIRPGDVCEHTLQASVGGVLEGTVHAGGRPVAGASVGMVLPPHAPDWSDGWVLHGVPVWRLDADHFDGPRNPAAHRSARTDAAGRYRLDGLPPGRHRVLVTADGLSFDRRMEVEIRDVQVTRLQHDLEPAGALQVATLSTSCIGLTRIGDDLPTLIVHSRGTATIPGLAPGRYVVQDCDSGAPVAPVTLGEVEVVAGRTTWVDLRGAGVAARITGQVVAGGDPIANASVHVDSTSGFTDGRGRFVLETGSRPAFERVSPLGVRLRGIDFSCVPEETQPSAAADLVIDLGNRTIDVRCLTADGAPAAAWIELSGDTPDDAAGIVRHVRVRKRTDDAGVARIGPLPTMTLRGSAIFDDAYRQAVTVESNSVGSLMIARPATGILEIRVVRNGAPFPDVTVEAGAWPRAEPPPTDAAAFRRGTRIHATRSDAEGVATLVVPAGEILVSADTLTLVQNPVRTTLAAGTTRRVTIEIPPE